jgi:hypothetical protein
MAERLMPKRSTEKTSAVLPRDAAPADKPASGASAPSGHGRHSAAAFRGARRVCVAHVTLHVGDLCPECRRGKSVSPEGADHASEVCGARATGSHRLRDGAAALQCLRAGVHRRRTGDGGPGQVRCHGRLCGPNVFGHWPDPAINHVGGKRRSPRTARPARSPTFLRAAQRGGETPVPPNLAFSSTLVPAGPC